MRMITLATTSVSIFAMGLATLAPAVQAETPASRLLGQAMPRVQTTPQVTLPASNLGIIEASADSTPAVIDVSRAQTVLNEANQYARVRAIRDQMRFQERRDLLLSDYVGNQNYNRATAGQQFGRLAWDSYYGSLPFTDY